MGTSPVLTVLELHRCGEVYWQRTAVRDEFISYDVQSGEVISLQEETVQARKQMQSKYDAQTYITLLVVTAYSHASELQVTVDIVQRD